MIKRIEEKEGLCISLKEFILLIKSTESMQCYEKMEKSRDWIKIIEADIYGRNYRCKKWLSCLQVILDDINHDSLIEKRRLISFILETDFIYDMSYLLFMNSNEKLNDETIIQFLKSINYESKENKDIIICQLYSIASTKMRNTIELNIKNTIDTIPYRMFIQSLRSGIIKYDHKTRDILTNHICKFDYSDLICNSYKNPVYALIKLYIGGIIDFYELKQYQMCCQNNIMYQFVIDPENFEYEKFRDEWWPLLLVPDFLNAWKKVKLG